MLSFSLRGRRFYWGGLDECSQERPKRTQGKLRGFFCIIPRKFVFEVCFKFYIALLIFEFPRARFARTSPYSPEPPSKKHRPRRLIVFSLFVLQLNKNYLYLTVFISCLLQESAWQISSHDTLQSESLLVCGKGPSITFVDTLISRWCTVPWRL